MGFGGARFGTVWQGRETFGIIDLHMAVSGEVRSGEFGFGAVR